ncbi:MAG TPA: helix-hairpin-helix domain-containing protein [Acetobacteraceae bacterium]|jgi:Holliday junction resolvasome RuvABC DNA-binding subunit|nr:helix-hairpin-helix domain-containing protein [Acetobacteraceae bacterium]
MSDAPTGPPTAPQSAPSLADVAPPPTNRWIATQFRAASAVLQAQGANPFRINAYRRAAETLERQPIDVRAIAAQGGFAALDALPGIGPSLAGAIVEMLNTGHWTFLERLQGASGADAVFASVPGIGPRLAQRVYETLHVDTLEALETAAHDGRLEMVPGFGPRRVAMVRHALAVLLARMRPPAASATDEPPVEVLLDIDREYRSRASLGDLPHIAPKRFNEAGTAWLPVLHTERGPWHATALFSNSARAHQLGRTADWVVIYFHRDGVVEGRRTVVTEGTGPDRGRRVVRGRESECRAI